LAAVGTCYENSSKAVIGGFKRLFVKVMGLTFALEILMTKLINLEESCTSQKSVNSSKGTINNYVDRFLDFDHQPTLVEICLTIHSSLSVYVVNERSFEIARISVMRDSK